MGTSPSVLSSIEGDLDTVWGNTLGVVWSGITGTVDPWTKANITTGAQQSVTKALGPNATCAEIGAAQDSVSCLITKTLTSIGADPSQASVAGGLSNAGSYWFGAGGILNPANWSSTTILIVAGLVIAAFLALGWGLHH